VSSVGGGREGAEATPEVPPPLDSDDVAAIAILLVAAADLGSWLAGSSIAVVGLRALWVLIYLVTAARLLQRYGTEWVAWTIRHQPALSALLVLTLASCLWSLAPALTLRKAVSLLGTTVLGLFIGFIAPPQRITRVLAWAFGVLVVSSIAVTLLWPASTQPLGWRGILSHKNSLGAAAALAAIVWLIFTLRRRVHPVWGVALSVLSLLALVGARSRTAFLALGVSLLAAAYLAIGGGAPGSTHAVVRRMTIGLVLAVSITPFLVAPLATVLGTSDPLNGRLALWDGTLTILRERPLTGYGYDAVWGRDDATLLPHIPITAWRSSKNAHNSIADIASQLGIPAAIIGCLYLLGALIAAGRLVERAPSTFAYCAFAVLLGMTVMSFTEAHLLRIHSIFWMLFVALTVSAQRALPSELE